MTNKRGISTVEMIVSFTIFFAFVVFIMAYLNPIKKDISSSLLDNLDAGMKKNAMSDLMEVPLITIEAPTNCISVDLNNPSFPLNISKGNFSVKALDNSIIPHFRTTTGFLYIQNTADKLYRIIQSDEINITNTAMSGVCGFPYTLSVERDERIYSYKKLVGINSLYYGSYASYTQLKQQLNYPITSDFAIVITNDEVNFSMMRNISSNTKVQVRRYPIQILKNDIKKDASMSLIVW